MATKSTARLATKTELGPVATAYLVAYNVAQTLGWSALMLILMNYLYMYVGVLDTPTDVEDTLPPEAATGGLYKQTEMLLKIFQTAALLEVVHCAIGLVRSSVILTGAQVASRVFLVWGIVHTVPAVQSSIGVPLFHLAWTITEIIRYSFYTFQLIGQVPFAIKWCRYTFFILLYPLGVTGELLCLYAALPYIRKSRIYSLSMPNPANIAFDYFYFIIVVMFSYLPIFPQLYFHMLAQRKKVLSEDQNLKSQ